MSTTRLGKSTAALGAPGASSNDVQDDLGKMIDELQAHPEKFDLDDEEVAEVLAMIADPEVMDMLEGANDETQHRRKWMKIAMSGKCSKEMDKLFDAGSMDEAQKKELIAFKKKCFTEIYQKLAKDHHFAENIDSCLVVRNVKFTPMVVMALTVLTLGLFLCLRPGDDDVLLVLTKDGQVLTMKVDRIGIFSTSPLEVLLEFAKYIFFLMIFLSVPALLFLTLLSLGKAGTAAREASTLSYIMDEEFEQYLIDKVKTNIIKCIVLCMIAACGFICWLWSKCPQDFGNRHRECYLAEKVSAWQLRIKGRKGMRRHILNINFGYYPSASQLEENPVGSTSGVICTTMRVLDLGSAPGGAAGVMSSLGRGSGTATCVVLALTVVTLLDAGVTWLGRAIAVKSVMEGSQYCMEPTVMNSERECSFEPCKVWAEERKRNKLFCSHLTWHSELNSTSHISTCGWYGTTPPCCGGCVTGQAAADFGTGGWLKTFEEVISIITDIVAVLFTLMAASTVIKKDKTSEVCAVRLREVAWKPHMDPTSNAKYTVPLMRHFLEKVLAKARSVSLDGLNENKSHFLKVHEASLFQKDPVASIGAAVQVQEEEDDPLIDLPQLPAKAQRVVAESKRVPTFVKPVLKKVPKRSCTSAAVLAGGGAWEAEQAVWRKKRDKIVAGLEDEESPLIEVQDLDGDGEQDNTGFIAGVTNFSIDNTATTWDEFFNERNLTERLPKSWYRYKVNVPLKCLALISIDDEPMNPLAEKVIASWSERPQLSMTEVLFPSACGLCLMIGLLVSPESLGGSRIILPDYPDTDLGFVASAATISGVLVLLSILYSWFTHFCQGVQHAVILTDQRCYYIRYLPKFLLFGRLGLAVRVDCYRHNRAVTYGRCESTYIPFWYRLIGGAKWVPGWVTMQTAFGVIRLRRRQGNIFNIFSAVTQLSPISEMDFLKKDGDAADDRWDYAKTAAEAERGMIRRRQGVRQFVLQEGDICHQGPPIYMATQKNDEGDVEEFEKPLFHWAFQHVGLMSSKFNDNYDVLVTSGRVFVWSRSWFKSFDCRTSICWGFCWCGCISRLTSQASVPNGISFFTLPNLLSFSSNVVVEPPIWVDPTHAPLRFPLVETLCDKLTKCITCDFKGMTREEDEDWRERFSPFPARRRPRIQLWLAWRLGTCLVQQPDLIASARPFKEKGFQDQELLNVLHLKVKEVLGLEDADSEEVKKHDLLRIVMAVAQKTAALQQREIIAELRESSDEEGDAWPPPPKKPPEAWVGWKANKQFAKDSVKASGATKKSMREKSTR